MVRRPSQPDRGQALVEFALILLVLLMLIFVVIEGAHLFQAQLTVQNAARAAGRYAVTGQYDESCLSASPPCEDVRLFSIRAVAEEAMAGLRLDPGAGFFDPAFYEIEIFGTDAAGNLIADNPGLAGRPVIVRVLYRAEVITPLLRPIARTVLVRGQTVMNNESPVQGQTGSSGNAPAVPALPPPLPTPTAAPAGPPDLSVDKWGPAQAMINSNFQYSLEVGNQGQDDATGVVLTDTLPGIVDFLSASPGCTNAAGVISCALGTLPVGSSDTVTVAVRARDVTGPAQNAATVDSASATPEDSTTLGDNTDTVVTQIVTSTTTTDIQLTKSGPNTAVLAEHDFFFNLTVRNAGLITATGVIVTDTLPAGMDYRDGVSDSACSEVPADSGVIECAIGSLSPGQSTLLLIGVTAPAAQGTYENSARVDAAAPLDPDQVNNEDTHSVTVIRRADLWITKVGSPPTLNAGELLTYTLQVGNRGPNVATNVSIDDVLPPNVSFVSASISPLTGARSCQIGGDIVTCDAESLDIDETASVTIVVIPEQGGTIINSAQVSSLETDLVPDNNAAAANTVYLETDLSIVKSAPAEVFAGDFLSYQLVVTNDGPSTASGVTISDTLPLNAAYYDTIASQGFCVYDDDTRLVDCSLGSIVATETATVTIRTIPTQPGEYSNTAEVTGNEPDPDASNDDDVTSTALPGVPTLYVQPSCERAGATVQIRGFVWSDARDITLTWWDEDDNFIQNIGTVEARSFEDNTFSFTFVVPAGTARGSYYVKAFQEGQGNDNDTEVDTAIFKVPCDGPDLVLGEINHALSVAQGDPVTFTVNITNAGPLPAASPFYVSLYFDPSPTPTVTTTHILNDTRQEVVAFSSLVAGGSRTVTFTVESLNVLTGTLPIYVVVDSDPGPTGSIVEMEEADNIASSVLTVTQGTLVDPPTGSFSLFGATLLGPNTQSNVRVSVYTGTTWLATTYSDINGRYAFDNVLPDVGLYDLQACFVINGQSYFALLPNRPPFEDSGSNSENLSLTLGPCP